MSEHRKKTCSVCLKNGAKGNVTLELFAAPQWGGPAGMYRLRLAGRWLDGGRFYRPADIGRVIAAELLGLPPDAVTDAPAPDMPKGTPVCAPNGTGGMDGTHVATEAPFRGYDGRWYVGCYLYGRGDVMIPCDDVIVKTRAR